MVLPRKVLLLPKDKDPARELAVRMLCGGMAGGISIASTYPLDIVRARMAIQPGDAKMLLSCPSTLTCVFQQG